MMNHDKDELKKFKYFSFQQLFIESVIYGLLILYLLFQFRNYQFVLLSIGFVLKEVLICFFLDNQPNKKALFWIDIIVTVCFGIGFFFVLNFSILIAAFIFLYIIGKTISDYRILPFVHDGNYLVSEANEYYIKKRKQLIKLLLILLVIVGLIAIFIKILIA